MALALVAGVASVLALMPRAGLAQQRDIDGDITTASERLEVLIERYDAVRSDLRATQSRVAATTARLDDLSGRLAAARQRVASVASWAYKTGPASQFSAVLAADSPGAFMRRMSTLDDLTRTQTAQIAGLTDLAQRLETERTALSQLADEQSRQAAELGRLTANVEADIARMKQLRASRSARPPSLPTPTVGAAATKPPAVSASAPPGAGRAVAFAYAQIGRPYRYGTDGPDSYDCSGLVMAAWRAAGAALPHNAARQFGAIPHVTREQLRPGDLVFYYGDIHHVAIYVGRGSVIHAPNVGEHVRVQSIDLAPIHGYGRPA